MTHETTSTATLFFFNFFAILTRSFCRSRGIFLSDSIQPIGIHTDAVVHVQVGSPNVHTCDSASGLPTKMTMRWRWFLFCRCFSAS
jgi:hypothetical protein